jgi:hypothetical protein
MQEDMHYYGTLAMAVAAGIPRRDAEVIAYAAQFVDDSTGEDSSEHKDHGLLYGISTAHHPLQSFLDRVRNELKENTEEQRKIWVPFHFLPGGGGESLSEKLLCIKDSAIARQLLKNNLTASLIKPFGLELMGITAHVYMDTFSHYGFSGIASSYNEVKSDAIELLKKPVTEEYIKAKFAKFLEKAKAKLAQSASKYLGHAGVATYADRPYLQWKFQFVKPRPGNGCESIRDNAESFLAGCKALHGFFADFARAKYAERHSCKSFESIEAPVKKVLSCEAELQGRIKAWEDSGLIKGCRAYNAETWQNEKMFFAKYAASGEGINTNAYRFHQAAAYHRYYVLKDLLPSHGIAVY